MKRIVIYIMRHGEKQDDMLTEAGIKQVIDSTQHNLKGINFDLAYYSGMNRTKDTVATALQALGIADKKQFYSHSEDIWVFQKEEGFSYVVSPYEDNLWPIQEAQKKVEAAKDKGELETADLWLKNWPKALIIRGRLQKTLLLLGKALNENPIYKDQEVINILVASHSPTAELAALEPRLTPKLSEADIIRYTLVNHSGEMKIISSDVLHAPY